MDGEYPGGKAIYKILQVRFLTFLGPTLGPARPALGLPPDEELWL